MSGPESQAGTPQPRVVMVAAVARNGVIGQGGDIPWSIPEDLKHFRATTTGHTVLMGRATFASIGHPLPYRTNVVVTRQPDWSAEGVFVAHSVEEGLQLAQSLDGDVMVIGGGEVYRAAMPYATDQVLTEVDLEPEGDTRYPDFDPAEWREVRREPHEGYAFVWWERGAGG
jgi:dihydrofolate reductase